MTAFAVVLTTVLGAGVSPAQDIAQIRARGTLETVSTGQPSGIQALWGPSLGYSFDDKEIAARLNLGLDAEVLLPQIGLLRFATEGFVGVVGQDFDPGLGAFLKFPYVNPGLEYNFRQSDVFFKLTLLGSPRRGGLLGFGDRVRVDWVPRTGLIQMGIAIEQPFGTYRQNRPRNRHVYMKKDALPRPWPVENDLLPPQILAELKDSMVWMDRLYSPQFGLYDPSVEKSRRKFDKRAAVVQERVKSTGRGFVEEDERFHDLLEEAFTHASGDDREAGAVLARESEKILLQAVIVPVNRLFGRLKKPIDLSQYINEATFEFSVLLGEFEFDRKRTAAVSEVFRHVAIQLNEVAKAVKKRWDDSRLVWLPLNYGLRRDQLDSQSKLNAVFQQVTGGEFTRCNDLGYLFNDDFYYFYKDLILDTEYYQVTVIHDFRNKSGKEADQVAWSIVADGYTEAFIRAIEEMDRGERTLLPEFTLFLDEYYYRQNRSRPIITYMENLYEPRSVQIRDKDLQEKVLRQQERLQDAVSASPALARFGKEYVRKNLKVHINITHQFDPTFKEDAFTRDHRKMAFRDIFEESPESGIAVFTGEGIGEYYLGPSWEDRSLVLRGPALVKLKKEVRQLFLNQGFQADDVPFFLRPRPLPPDYEALCQKLRAKGWTTTADIAMNQTGFLKKPASVAKATLYNLLGPGSVLLAPDSIWSCDYWASLFIASALRGIHVFAISPSADHAPSAAPPTLELIRESLACMARGAEVLGAEIDSAGGSLNVGIFETDFDACNPLDRVEAFLGPRAPALSRAGFQMHSEIRRVFEAERQTLLDMADSSVHVTDFGSDRKTKLHQKTQFFLTEEAVQVLSRPEWASFLSHYLEHLRERCLSPDRNLEGVQPEWLGIGQGAPTEESVVGGFESDVSVSGGTLDRAAFFLLIGSQNQDRRGALLDGEVLVTVPGYESLVALMDFAFWLRLAKWLESSEEVDQYFPPQGGLIKSFSRWIKNLI